MYSFSQDPPCLLPPLSARYSSPPQSHTLKNASHCCSRLTRAGRCPVQHSKIHSTTSSYDALLTPVDPLEGGPSWIHTGRLRWGLSVYSSIRKRYKWHNDHIQVHRSVSLMLFSSTLRILNHIFILLLCSPGNHSITQSTFAQPCNPMPGGFDSGNVLIPASNVSQTPEWNLTVVNATSRMDTFSSTPKLLIIRFRFSYMVLLQAAPSYVPLFFWLVFIDVSYPFSHLVGCRHGRRHQCPNIW